MSGNPLVRFDEGRVGRTFVSPSLLLYRLRGNWYSPRTARLTELNPASTDLLHVVLLEPIDNVIARPYRDRHHRERRVLTPDARP
jgi:hypothetical protein